jgi:ABC-type protease/lipase transport system fused ATPase/permease subunit
MKLAATLLLAAAGIYAIGDAVLATTPTPEHPGFVDAVLASRAVIAAIRLAIIFAGIYVIVSVIALITRGQWLTRVGPVEVSERVADADTEILRLEGELGQARGNLVRLRQDLSTLTDLAAVLSQGSGREGSK